MNNWGTNPVSYLREAAERQGALFAAQPAIVQRFLEMQAQRLVQDVLNHAYQTRFSLPDKVVAKMPHSAEMATMLVPAAVREQALGGWRARFYRQNLRDLLRLRLSELEQSPDQAIHTGAELIRYAVAVHMIYRLLPDGRSVTYQAEAEEQIPSIPEPANGESESAITARSDAIVEQGINEAGRGELLVPFVPAARRFYLPQWVAFDENDRLLVNSLSEAQAHQASMERYVDVLHAASSLAPYMVADSTYQRKRYGMLGQVINQGRALARYQTEQIIRTIQERVKKGTLNRGLSISLPYYNDQDLCLTQLQLEVIPAGRIGFKSIFVVRATRLERAKVSQDTRLNASTRKHLLHQLDRLEQAFVNFKIKE